MLFKRLPGAAGKLSDYTMRFAGGLHVYNLIIPWEPVDRRADVHYVAANDDEAAT